jgi:RNA polymerase sigma-70 factor (ECF subfamily)
MSETLEVRDEDLVEGAKRGDTGSVSALYERYYDRVYRFALAKTGSVPDAEDVAQETFIRMVDKVGGFHWQGAPFSAWLFRIANNCAVDIHRSRRRLQDALPMLVDHGSVDPAEEAELHLTTEEVSVAMQRLSAAQRDVLSLRFGAELSVAEVARVLGKAEGTVKATQFQAVQALRSVLGQGKDGDALVHAS